MEVSKPALLSLYAVKYVQILYHTVFGIGL